VFERLDEESRRVVEVALGAAHGLGQGWLGTEHVLIGVLTYRELLPPAAVALLPEVAAVRERLVDGLRSDPARLSDDALLATLGIDVAEVRRRAAAAFGADAVQRAAMRVRSVERRPRRRRRCGRTPRCKTILPGDGLGMAPRLKRAVDLAARQSGGTSINPRVLLGALLAIEDGLACEVLRGMGADVPGLRAALDPPKSRP
jgi:hypothetical protein